MASSSYSRYNRICIFGAKSLSEREIFKSFHKFGTIRQIYFCRDNETNERKDACLVTYLKVSSAAEAIEAMNGKRLSNSSRPLKVVLSVPRNERISDSDPMREIRMLCLDIVAPRQLCESDIRKHFEKFGRVDDIKFFEDREITLQSHRRARVKFFRLYDAALAYENCDARFKPAFPTTPAKYCSIGAVGEPICSHSLRGMCFSDTTSYDHIEPLDSQQTSAEPSSYSSEVDMDYDITDGTNCVSAFEKCIPQTTAFSVENSRDLEFHLNSHICMSEEDCGGMSAKACDNHSMTVAHVSMSSASNHLSCGEHTQSGCSETLPEENILETFEVQSDVLLLSDVVPPDESSEFSSVSLDDTTNLQPVAEKQKGDHSESGSSVRRPLTLDVRAPTSLLQPDNALVNSILCNDEQVHSSTLPLMVAANSDGWNLFGKMPPKQAQEKNSVDISLDYKNKVLQAVKPNPCPLEAVLAKEQVTRRSDKEVPSTTALILQQRPGRLPSKSPEKTLRHQMIYDEMVRMAKKKDASEMIVPSEYELSHMFAGVDNEEHQLMTYFPYLSHTGQLPSTIHSIIDRYQITIYGQPVFAMNDTPSYSVPSASSDFASLNFSNNNNNDDLRVQQQQASQPCPEKPPGEDASPEEADGESGDGVVEVEHHFQLQQHSTEDNTVLVSGNHHQQQTSFETGLSNQTSRKPKNSVQKKSNEAVVSSPTVSSSKPSIENVSLGPKPPLHFQDAGCSPWAVNDDDDASTLHQLGHTHSEGRILVVGGGAGAVGGLNPHQLSSSNIQLKETISHPGGGGISDKRSLQVRRRGPKLPKLPKRIRALFNRSNASASAAGAGASASGPEGRKRSLAGLSINYDERNDDDGDEYGEVAGRLDGFAVGGSGTLAGTDSGPKQRPKKKRSAPTIRYAT